MFSAKKGNSPSRVGMIDRMSLEEAVTDDRVGVEVVCGGHFPEYVYKIPSDARRIAISTKDTTVDSNLFQCLAHFSDKWDFVREAGYKDLKRILCGQWFQTRSTCFIDTGSSPV
jgi:hypothetical protein